jgi:hypothetical protein
MNCFAMKKLTLTEMENLNGGMACWAAKVGLIAAGIAFVASGGWLLVAASLGLALSEWGYLESCFPQLMQ